MDATFEILRGLSWVAFLGYGLHCLVSPAMVAEFRRYGLARFRTLTGALEVLGALGLIASYVFPALAVVAAGGLALLMLLGVLTRLRIRDPWWAALPAFLLLGVNAFVCVHAARAFGG